MNDKEINKEAEKISEKKGAGLKTLLADPIVQWIFEQCRQHRGQIRLVGGCVRDALIDKSSSDIDFSVDLLPHQVIEIFDHRPCEYGSCRVIPTGLKHGTVTLVIGTDHGYRSFEITTLRCDMETDGRHAQVAFTADWQQDAGRRDFTMNALYLDQEGKIYDFFNGVKDLEQGIVRFIGDPYQRIREDFLRILRYYRFCQRFSSQEDLKSKVAVLDLQQGLLQLSKERIQSELFKILGYTDPLPIIHRMYDVFQTLFGAKPNVPFLEELLERQQGLNEKGLSPIGESGKSPSEYDHNEALLRLFGLYPYPPAFFKNSLKLFNRQKDCLEKWQSFLSMTPSKQALFEVDYHCGLNMAISFMILTMKEDQADFCDLIEFGQTLKLKTLQSIATDPNDRSEKGRSKGVYPCFPLTGKDLVNCGIEPGKTLGRLLQSCKAWWLQELGEPTFQECLAFVQKQKPEK